MNEPIITWYLIDSDDSTVLEKQNYIGDYNLSSSEMTLHLQVWNNKFGNYTVSNIENPILNIMFSTIEDNSMLKYIKVKVDNNDYEPLNVLSEKGTLNIYRTLSGEPNNGSLEESSNYIDLRIKIEKINYKILNGLKSMILDITYL